MIPLMLFAQEVTEPTVICNEAGAVIASRHHVYDSHNNLAVIIEYTYDDNGVVESRTLRSYDKLGRELRMETYSADDYLLFVQQNKYDKQGRKTKTVQTSYDENGIPHTDQFQYKYTAEGCRTFLNGKEVKE